MYVCMYVCMVCMVSVVSMVCIEMYWNVCNRCNLCTVCHVCNALMQCKVCNVIMYDLHDLHDLYDVYDTYVSVYMYACMHEWMHAWMNKSSCSHPLYLHIFSSVSLGRLYILVALACTCSLHGLTLVALPSRLCACLITRLTLASRHGVHACWVRSSVAVSSWKPSGRRQSLLALRLIAEQERICKRQRDKCVCVDACWFVCMLVCLFSACVCGCTSPLSSPKTHQSVLAYSKLVVSAGAHPWMSKCMYSRYCPQLIKL